MCRGLVAAAAIITSIGTIASPAGADDPIVVGTPVEGGGVVIIGIPGSSGSPGIPSTGTGPTTGSGSTSQIVCSYYPDGDSDAADHGDIDPSTLDLDDWVWIACYDPGSGSPVGQPRRVQWNPSSPPPLQPSAANLAQVALTRLTVPLPAVVTWPPLGGVSLVNLPVWLHVTNWSTLTSSASAGGLTATVTATPVRMEWDMGEDSITCSDAGAALDLSIPPDQQQTDCSYTYRHSSGAQADGSFHGTGTIVWHLRWSATNGQGGDLGEISRTVAFSLRVEESQALVVSAQ